MRLKVKYQCLVVIFMVMSFVTFTQITLIAEAATPETEIFKWRLQSCGPRGSTETNTVERFAEMVKKASNGRLEIRVYGADEIVPSFETFGAISQGVLEMHCNDPAYWVGKTNQCSGIITMPFLFRNALDQRVFLEQKGGIKVLRDIYAKHNIYLINMFSLGNGTMWTRFPFSNLDDFKGKKIRAYGLWAEVLNGLGGMATVTLSSGEVYEAMARGVVDGLISGNIGWCYDYGFHEVSKYVWSSDVINNGSLEFAVNMDAWEKLPEDLKSILITCAKETEIELLTQNHEWDAKRLSAIKSEFKIQECALDEKSIFTIRQATLKKVEEFSKKYDDFAKLASILKDFMKEMGIETGNMK